MLRASACLLLAGLAGCIAPPSAAQRLADAAYDLNTAARFGRMDVALERVKEAAKEDFGKRHASWGKQVRIVDYEFAGLAIRKDGDADVLVTVTWQRLDESTIRVTEITQRWGDTRGTWWMLREEVKSGDAALLEEEKEKPKAAEGQPPAPAAPRDRGRYQTRVIYDQ
jgi:hypothetical protein